VLSKPSDDMPQPAVLILCVLMMVVGGWLGDGCASKRYADRCTDSCPADNTHEQWVECKTKCLNWSE